MKLLISNLMFLLVLAGCSSAIPDNPTAKSILKENPQVDILQYNQLIYTKVTEPELIKDNFIKSDKLGEIKKTTTSSLFFKDFYATKLPIGTEIFATDDQNTYTLIIELDGDQRIYKALIEG
ncbi:hypothetical protein [Lysinibacillus pakistanensis]|uniref:Lipoprotein n=1 Tax=Lysinibacillus pakistanensis TaxID=759811 RepID=A0AAX3WUW9_9BACI|nr:hypothetical protein [Lysinibacillus pakistanensis]MDM5229930.1 hypothetical protein [Lysinibacillus pakistanensis]WHY45530.1 hypothetical protein QNH22_19770 [Lysinibacillus pakistanensis]WHY50538.1 hypothetical protein QNH24_19735 [Lysinibacillus pakistanensis]